ncbi:MAG: hypothetical protein LAP85_29670 [Acidobacteriia bacterium]|nr:hypothetical protein [Terriglobia bacterium]
MVVLPFVNLSGDPAQEYLSDAMTDEVITAIASIVQEHLAVIARTTAMHYKGSHKDVAHIGRELNVDYVVEGTLRNVQDQIAVNVQLIQVSDQTHLFAGKFDAALPGIFHMQRRIAQAIATHIPAIADLMRTGAIAVGGGPRKPTGDLAAYNDYIQGRYCLDPDYIQGRYYLDKGTPESVAIAKQHLERAISRDPEFALGHDALAELHWRSGYFGWVSPRNAFSAGITHALRAIEIDASRAETHALLAQFHKTVEYNWAEVHRENAIALQLDPYSPLVRMRYAVSELMPHGRLEEAATELEGTLELDPLSVFAGTWLANVRVFLRQYERAAEQASKLIDLYPNFWGGHFAIAASYRYRKMFTEAVAAERMAVECSGGTALTLGWLGVTLAETGQTAEARNILKHLHEMAGERYVPPFSIALIHLGLREINTAFEWLNRAVDECDQLMMPIKSYGFFDPIRDDPRFKNLMRKMRLET